MPNEEDRTSDYKEAASEKLANASFVLGIISLFSMFCCCPFIISAVGITLALASKGASEALKPRAKTGLILSIVGIVISVFVALATLVMPIVLAKLNPEIGEQFKQEYRDTITENEDLFRQIYGDEEYDNVLDSMDELLDMF